ncbi:unnamed protein product [Gadus morhua 'NCC']
MQCITYLRFLFFCFDQAGLLPAVVTWRGTDDKKIDSRGTSLRFTTAVMTRPATRGRYKEATTSFMTRAATRGHCRAATTVVVTRAATRCSCRAPSEYVFRLR